MALSKQISVDTYRVKDTVKIAVNTEYGIVDVEFTIIAVLNVSNHIYALLAQDKVVKGQYMTNNTWKLSKPFDLHQLDIIEKTHQIIK